ncbi:hypothetical protein HS125_04620 [bacterium]|nr:hypothetical protein [bacterium]
MPAWLAAVVSPRARCRALLDEECEPVALLYTALAGITLLLAGASEKELSSSVRIGYMVFFCVILGPIAGWTALYLLSFLLTWTGGGGEDGAVGPCAGRGGLRQSAARARRMRRAGAGRMGGRRLVLSARGDVAVYVLLVGVAAARTGSVVRAAAALALSLILIAAPRR